MNDWDKILADFARKCKGGAPDMTKPRHLALLRESLIKFGWKENAANGLLSNLREGEDKDYKGKGTRTGKPGEYKYDYSEPSSKTDSESEEGGDKGGEIDTSIVSAEMDGMTEERDKIFTGETTPPGNGGSAVMETLGGLYSEELAQGEHQNETEDQFVDRMLQDYGDKPPLLGMSLKQQKLWLKVAYRKGRNDLHGLKNGPHDFNPDQPKGYPKTCSGDAKTAAPVLDALEKQLANCKNDIDPPKCEKHYKRQIKVFKKRVRLQGERASGQKDSDSLLIYYDNQGRMRVHHISDKQTLADTFMNMTLATKGESHARAMERTSARMGLTEEQSKDATDDISRAEEEAVSQFIEPSKTIAGDKLENQTDQDLDDTVDNGLGGAMGNMDAGTSRGRRNYGQVINDELGQNPTRGQFKDLQDKLDEMGAKGPPYSEEDIAKAILRTVRDNPSSPLKKYVEKMGGTVETARNVAKSVEKQIRKQAEKEGWTEEQIQDRINQVVADKMNGGNGGHKQDSQQPARPLTKEDIAAMRTSGGIMDDLVDAARISKDAMAAAHKHIKEQIKNEDKKFKEELQEKRKNGTITPQEEGILDDMDAGKNGPREQAYVDSWMNDMHFSRHFDGPPWDDPDDIEGDQDGGINADGKTLKSAEVMECLKSVTGYSGSIETKEDKQKFYKWLCESLKIDSDEDSVTIVKDPKNQKPDDVGVCRVTVDGQTQTKNITRKKCKVLGEKEGIETSFSVEVGKQGYRSGGVGVQKVTGNLGKSVQDCLKKALKSDPDQV